MTSKDRPRGRGTPRSGLRRWAAVALATLLAATGVVGSQTGIASAVVMTTFYVSPTGNDSNNGETLSTPFATLTRAQQAVRDEIGAGMTGDIEVQLRGGTYYQAQSLTFTAADSGINGHKVVWRNYANEVPRLIGGKRITGWQLFQNGIYRVHLPDVDNGTWDFRHLVEDNTGAVTARFPNTGYLLSGDQDTLPATERHKQLKYNPADIPAGMQPTTGQISTFSGGTAADNTKWFNSIAPVASVDTTNNVIHLTQNTVQPIRTANSYFLQNRLAYLDTAGEFWLDRVTGYLYYKPRNPVIANATIVAPTVTDLINVQGTPAALAHDITFRGLLVWISDFTDYYQEIQTPYTGADFGTIDPNGKRRSGNVWNRPADRNLHGLFRLENTRRITIEDNNLAHAGFSAIALTYNTQTTTVRGNDIHHVGLYGVLLIGQKPGVTDAAGQQIYDNKTNTITDNSMSNTGRLVGHGGGVFINQSGDNTVTHNRIRQSPRYGIVVKGNSFDEMPLTDDKSVAITLGNYHNYLTSRDNVMSYNDIANVMQDSSDGGTITTRGIGLGNNIVQNHLRGVIGPHARGIYLDDESDHVTIRANIVHVDDHAAISITGWNITVTNNIMVQTTGAGKVPLVIGNNYGSTRTVANAQHVITKNVFYTKTDIFEWMGGWQPNRVATMDYNWFHAQTGQYEIKAGSSFPVTHTLAGWQTAESGKYDQNSLTGDPLFVDPANDDYQLEPTSPVYGLGFAPINVDDIGLTSAYSPPPNVVS